MLTMAPKRKTPFAKRLQALRNKHELTQREAAKLIGVAYRTLVNWENGQQPSAIARRLISQAFPNDGI